FLGIIAVSLVGCFGDQDPVAVTVRSEQVELENNERTDPLTDRTAEEEGARTPDGSEGDVIDGRQQPPVTENGGEETQPEDAPDPMSFVEASLSWRVDRDEAYTLLAEGGVPPYTWTLQNANLALQLRLQDGKLHGHPLISGDFRAKIRMTDTRGQYAEKEFGIKVTDNPSLVVRRCTAVRNASGALIDCRDETDVIPTGTSNVPLERDQLLKFTVAGRGQHYEWRINIPDLELTSLISGAGSKKAGKSRKARRSDEASRPETSTASHPSQNLTQYLQLKNGHRHIAFPSVRVEAVDAAQSGALWEVGRISFEDPCSVSRPRITFNDQHEKAVMKGGFIWESVTVQGGVAPYRVNARGVLHFGHDFSVGIADGCRDLPSRYDTPPLDPREEQYIFYSTRPADHKYDEQKRLKLIPNALETRTTSQMFTLSAGIEYEKPLGPNGIDCTSILEDIFVEVTDRCERKAVAVKRYRIENSTFMEKGFEGQIALQVDDVPENAAMVVEFVDPRGMVIYRSQDISLYSLTTSGFSCPVSDDPEDCVKYVHLKMFKVRGDNPDVRQLLGRILFINIAGEIRFRFFGLHLDGNYWFAEVRPAQPVMYTGSVPQVLQFLPTWTLSRPPRPDFVPPGQPSSRSIESVVCGAAGYICMCDGSGKTSLDGELIPNVHECRQSTDAMKILSPITGGV
ncbi:MAG: hypothetical protein HY540_05435, partial [Deltaproteobacteria bacterium]|nr:hypothetical protein [Deltaproteobacteria bacterium]